MANVPRELFARVLRGPGSLAVAGAAVNGGNLLANLVLARVLNATDYGALVVQTGIFLILSMGGSALGVAVVRRDTSGSVGTRHQRGSWIQHLRAACVVVSVLTCAAGLLVSRPTAVMLSYPHPLAIAESIAAAGIWVSLSVERGLLQARRSYQDLATNFLVEGVARITATIMLVCAGLGVNGAGLGLILGLLLAVEHARRSAGRTSCPAADTLGAPGPTGSVGIDSTGPLLIRATPRVRTRHALWHDTTTALGALVPLAMLQNMDVVIVGWLNPDEVGAYAAIATACKVPVFIGLAVANFLLPEAARRREQGQPATAALVTAVGWVIAPGMLLVAIGVVAAEPLLAAVFGPNLTAGAPALPVLALAMTCHAVALLFANYLLGVGRRGVVGVLLTATALTAAGLVTAGGELVATATLGLACHAAAAATVGFMVYRAHSPAALARSAGVGGSAGRESDEPVRASEVTAQGQRRPGTRGLVSDGTGGDRGYSAPPLAPMSPGPTRPAPALVPGLETGALDRVASRGAAT